jgi:hypothetical protein
MKLKKPKTFFKPLTSRSKEIGKLVVSNSRLLASGINLSVFI